MGAVNDTLDSEELLSTRVDGGSSGSRGSLKKDAGSLTQEKRGRSNSGASCSKANTFTDDRAYRPKRTGK